jgi:hypothetical protein
MTDSTKPMHSPDWPHHSEAPTDGRRRTASEQADLDAGRHWSAGCSIIVHQHGVQTVSRSVLSRHASQAEALAAARSYMDRAPLPASAVAGPAWWAHDSLTPRLGAEEVHYLAAAAAEESTRALIAGAPSSIQRIDTVDIASPVMTYAEALAWCDESPGRRIVRDVVTGRHAWIDGGGYRYLCSTVESGNSGHTEPAPRDGFYERRDAIDGAHQGATRPQRTDLVAVVDESGRVTGYSYTPASDDQIVTIRARAYNATARAMQISGVTLTHEQADDLGEAAIDWLRARLGLTIETTDDGVLARP